MGKLHKIRKRIINDPKRFYEVKQNPFWHHPHRLGTPIGYVPSYRVFGARFSKWAKDGLFVNKDEKGYKNYIKKILQEIKEIPVVQTRQKSNVRSTRKVRL